MKKYLLVLFIVLSNNFLFAQAQFKKVITYGLNYNLLPALKNSSGNYLLTEGNSVIKIDSSSNILSFHSWIVTNFIIGYNLFYGFTKAQNENYVFLSADEDTTSQYGGDLLFMTDTSGLILWKHVYDTVPTYGGSLTTLSEGGFLMSGTVLGNDVLGGYVKLRKVDSLGNQIWRKYYNSNNNYIDLTIVKELQDGNYLIGLSGDSHKTLGTGLLKVDTSGNPIWCKSYFRPKSYLMQMLENPDRSLMLLMLVPDSNNINLSSLYLMKVDSSGSFLWAKSYGFFNVNASLRSTTDNGYIISTDGLLLIKTDSTGNVQWVRRHGGISTDEGAIDAIPTNDGGYFVIAHTDAANPGPGFYIIKTDSLGFADSCQQYTDTLIVNSVFTTDSLITMPDTTLPLLTFNSTIHDTVLLSPLVFDGCDLSVGIPKYSIDKSKITVYPNPTEGKVNIRNDGTYTGEGRINIYDDIGNMILQKPYNDEKDAQIDLSEYRKGVYLIKILWNGGMSINKVIVE